MKIPLNKVRIACLIALILFLAGSLYKQNQTLSTRSASIADFKKQIDYLDNKLCKIYDEQVEMEFKIRELEADIKVNDEFLNTNYYLSTNGLVRTGMNAAEIAVVLGTEFSLSHSQPQINYPGETNHVNSHLMGWRIYNTKDTNISPFETCFIVFDKTHPANESPGLPMCHNADYTDSRWIAKSISLKFRKEAKTEGL